jgi:hypothetical protein
MSRFVALMKEHATVIGCNVEVEKASDSLRVWLALARQTGLSATALLDYSRRKKHSRLGSE